MRRRSPVLASKRARSLKARSSYPTVSIVRLGRGPLRRLAWIFGLDR
jgi:hypothetical protein